MYEQVNNLVLFCFQLQLQNPKHVVKETNDTWQNACPK